MNRRTATKVKNGRVQKKNNHKLTPNYWNTRQDVLQIDVEPAGKGYKHFLKKRDIIKFLEILPNWEEIDIDLNAIVLARGEYNTAGWYYSKGVIGICAREKDTTQYLNLNFFYDHKDLFDRLELRYEMKKDYVICHWEEYQIRAYLLLHILLHEMGHHHDRITTKSKKYIARGEEYAESYAIKYEKIIWNRYFECFDQE
ncbi:hypothetical protein M2451_001593 [Dysgonomonas sp. PFB1-18]|uniref:hypothetical protein n=1 Tax=unclassified Dysgonomonas TaxID=2630389 RepID=UPI0024767556|nr:MULTISPECIES: hypothetical protein [unclassified Dysgonomonas]MDH6308949.1 hypothetical protein [Dysgonomonas sp. PF1-14]MDH6338700.1 hypothetical protein [Dysgonomonas sp. PF1-16]MDH6380272.1 hypothetical protein [Dysgonomonas sp. PFB1-18]MDH6397602.1 hypothetical protein [Dysgonomonas sp. PF1-23]